MFLETLASDPGPKPNVFWMAPEDNETPKQYLGRVAAEAKEEGATLAHRRGGGASLGLRLASNSTRPQRLTWSLQGAPKSWSAQDVLQCLADAKVTETEVLRPPNRRQGWIVKGIVPDVSALGVVAIEAGHCTLMLVRSPGRVVRTASTVSRMKGSGKSFHEPAATRVLVCGEAAKNRSASKEASKEDGDGRDRSRSPDRSNQPAQVPHANKIDILDLAAGGECGYLCVTAALGLDKGLSLDEVKKELPSRAKTTRYDIFKHLEKHASDYQPFYEPNSLAGSPEQEAGAIPGNWSEFLESTLRPGRWICGLSLLAAAKRFGVCIVVVPMSGCAKDRPMKFGQDRSGRPTIVLILETGHYRLARLKEGKSWPTEWMNAEEAEVTSKMLRAGGGHAVPETPRKQTGSWAPDATPSPAASGRWGAA